MHPSLCPFVSIPLPCNLPLEKKHKGKTKKKQNKQNYLGVKAAVYHGVSQSKPFCANSLTLQMSLVWSDASGFCYTINAGSSHDSSHILLLLVSWRSQSFGSAGRTPPYTPVDGLGQLKAQDLGLSGSWGVQPTISPAPTPPRLALQHCPASSPNAAAGKGWGQLSCTRLLETSSPTPLPPGPALLCYLGEVEGPTLLSFFKSLFRFGDLVQWHGASGP